MDKHTSYDLAQMQSLPLAAKITMTKRRIEEWYEAFDGNVYVSFSGGKDSTVLKHIVDSMYDDVPSVFVNTGLEYPEIQKFAMTRKNVITLRPKMSFTDVLKNYGYPVISKEISKDIYYARKTDETNIHYKKLFGTYMYKGEKSRFCCERYKYLYDAPFDISPSCCDVMKKRPVHEYEKITSRKPIMGTMAAESLLRKNAWIKNGCNAFKSARPKSQPLSFWTEQDVLRYIMQNEVEYCPIYGEIKLKDKEPDQLEGQINIQDFCKWYTKDDTLTTTGAKRTGCIFCMFGAHLDEEPNRFQRLKETHPKQYKYCIGGGVRWSMGNGNQTKTVSVSDSCLITLVSSIREAS